MKKFNTAIVGYGWVATAHIPAINATTLGQVTAICSPRKLDAAELSSKYGRPIQVYNDLDELIANPDIHVLSLCGFPTQRLEQVTRAAKAGKHLILEKPLCLSLKELQQMRQAVRKAGVKTCVCFECRYASQFLATKAVIDRGLLGDLHYGEVDYYHGIGPWYDQFRWCKSKAEGGSSLLEAGCHALDALLMCMGSEVTEVMSYDTKSRSPIFAPYEFPSTSVTILKFKNGSVGKCASVIDCLQPYYFHTHLVGSKGSLLDNKFHSSDLGTNKTIWSSLGARLVDSGDVADHPYQTQFEAFFNALDKGKDMPLTSLEDAAISHEVIFAADRSAEKGRPVKMSEVGVKKLKR
ncbi:MAG: 4,5-dihydroxyphthalate dehydrogenase [Verrucomicrobia bacterium]|nr:MAG: 4,5-dihydroxyphthalate dehydrogenase [Verrucomicrobiota bacterium]